MHTRRHFLVASAAALAGCSQPAEPGAPPAPAASAPGQAVMPVGEADVVVVGGGLGGCAAALAALRDGARVLMTEETAWIGGQLTAQAVPPDEHQYVETHGCTRAYRDLRSAIRAYYRDHYPLLPSLKNRGDLNPGNGWVSRLCHEPRVSLAVLEGLLKPYVESRQLTLLRQTRAVGADVANDRVKAVRVRTQSGDEAVVLGRYFLDATEQGDLLPLCGAEHVTGFESHKQTGEPHAPDEAKPGEIQSFTVCFAVDYFPDEEHVIARPADYARFRDQVGSLGNFGFDPLDTANRFKTRAGKSNLWTYRRLLDRAQFESGRYASDVSLINWAQNDYARGSLHAVPEGEARAHLAQAKQLSLSLLYWLQTEAPRPDGKAGWKGLRLRKDLVGTADGLAMYPYVRESRRIKAEFTVLEQHIAKKLRQKEGAAEPFADSVGVGLYHYMDLHQAAGGSSAKPGFDGAIYPFQIPLGALLPIRLENLLPACKNLGVTHLTNGCYRMHPVEWNLGESAGALAAFCLKRREPPRQVRRDKGLLADYQKILGAHGVELAWPPGTGR